VASRSAPEARLTMEGGRAEKNDGEKKLQAKKREGGSATPLRGHFGAGERDKDQNGKLPRKERRPPS